MTRVLALGAWLKNAACLVDGGEVTWSPVHGDLGTPEACAALDASVERLLHGRRVDAVAHDLHPDFHSTRLALALADRLGVPAIGVQHHHAHIAVAMAEQRLEGPVVGLALDGVGLGSDGTAWGGEVLVVDGAAWLRLGHLQPLRLPGGDAAAREPWRMAAAVLHALGRGADIVPAWAPVVGMPLARGVATLLQRGLNCPPTTSAGRWFDAAAAALKLAVRQHDEAEAAMTLEFRATRWLAANGAPAVRGLVPFDDGVIDLRPLLARLFDTADADAGAALFHVALADALVRAARHAAVVSGARAVVLGGGCFFNRVLAAGVTTGLRDEGLAVHRPQGVSCGDAGLALGQAWVAARELERMEVRRCA